MEVDPVHGLRFKIESKKERELRKSIHDSLLVDAVWPGTSDYSQHDFPATVDYKVSPSFLKLHLSGILLEQQDKQVKKGLVILLDCG